MMQGIWHLFLVILGILGTIGFWSIAKEFYIAYRFMRDGEMKYMDYVTVATLYSTFFVGWINSMDLVMRHW